jgi:ABC-type transport system substrate-binding protein
VLHHLAGASSIIVNPDVVEEAGDEYGVSMVDGTGPYQLITWERNQRIVLERHDQYRWGPIFSDQGPAYLDGIDIRVIPEPTTRLAELQAGTIHLLQDVPAPDVDRLNKSDHGVWIVEFEQLQTTCLGMNTVAPPTNDLNVRKAVNLSVNREDIVEGANFGPGLPARTMMHPSMPSYWPDSEQANPTCDPEGVANLLEAGGWVAGDAIWRSGWVYHGHFLRDCRFSVLLLSLKPDTGPEPLHLCSA